LITCVWLVRLVGLVIPAIFAVLVSLMCGSRGS
jgi:hypothetical protein